MAMVPRFLSGGYLHVRSYIEREKGKLLGETIPYQKTRKESRKQARRKSAGEFTLLHVKGLPIQRSDSQTSLLSVRSTVSETSAISAFSNQRAADADDN